MQERVTNGSDKSHAGVFDWTQSGQSGAWGDPNQRFGNIQKDIPKTLLAYDYACGIWNVRIVPLSNLILRNRKNGTRKFGMAYT